MLSAQKSQKLTGVEESSLAPSFLSSLPLQVGEELSSLELIEKGITVWYEANKKVASQASLHSFIFDRK